MKLIFLGTPVFAVPTLKRLARIPHEIAVVITQPDRPRGRGMQLTPPPVKSSALELGLSVMQPEKVFAHAALEEIRKLRPEAAVVVAYGQLLKRDFLDLPPFGCINLHPSLLPRYRGSTPIQSAILAGDRKTGATTMLLDEGMDTGDILLQREVEILSDDTAGTLHDKLAEIGAELMVETLAAIESGSVTPQPQDESKATVTQKIGKKESLIDWTRFPGKICDLSRAMDPWPGCHTKFQGKPLKVWRVTPCEEHGRKARPGEVLKARHDTLIVQAGDGAVRILELQLPGGKRMSVEEFMRGHTIEEGAIFGE